MMSRRERSVAAIVAATLVTVTTVLFIVLAVIGYVSGHRAEEARLRHGAGGQAEELAAALALPVWNIDRAQIDKILDSQAQTPQVEAVVIEAAGKIQARARDRNGRFVPSDGNIASAGLIVAARNITFSGERIGSVWLYATPRYMQQQLRDSLMSMARTTIIINLLLILSVYLVLWSAVVRPLVEIEQYAAAVSSGASGTPVMTAHDFPKELDSVHSSIATMVQLLEERYSQLQESGERFRSIFNSVNDGIVINCIENGAILDANAAMCAMFGYSVDELRAIGIGPLSAGELSFTEANARMLIRRAADGEAQLFEWHSKHKDGHLFWTEVNLHVATIGDRRRSIVVVRDITQRKQMEEALRAEKEFTDTAINAMTGIFFVLDRGGRYVRWNQTMARTAALDGRRIEDMKVGDLAHPDDRQLIVQKLEDVFEQGAAELEARVVVAGQTRQYLLNARRMDIHGESFAVGAGYDVTERRRAEVEQKRLQDAVERSAAEWKETFDTVTTPIVIMERSGAVVRVNRAALELSGLSEEEIAGRSIDAIADGEPWQTASQLVSYIAGEKRGTTAETKDADGRTWDIIINRFSPNDDGAERFILVLWEITGIVELQESLRRSETLSAMGTLVAGVAHEVRNPLFGISATLDAFHDEMSQPGYKECGDTLRQEVNRLVHLMQELLEYGKPAALSIERGNVQDVVSEAVESRRSVARAAQVEIRNTMTAPMPTLLMDPSRLRQVFENLIDNAVQHSDPGMTVHIDGGVVDHAGRQWVEYRVEDEGPGFAPRDFDRVFEPFFSQRDGGTGLGLSIVQRIVEEHSGKVSAANRPEGGGSIRVLFPLGGAQ